MVQASSIAPLTGVALARNAWRKIALPPALRQNSQHHARGETLMKLGKTLVWIFVAALGAVALATLALHRG